jgi:hypothetical protein
MSASRAGGGLAALAVGSLPFTGLSLFLACLIGAGLLLLGFVLAQAGSRDRRDQG